MRLVGKAEVQRHLRRRLPKLQKPSRLRNANLGQVGVWRQPEVLLEESDEMKKTDTRRSCASSRLM